MLRYVFGMVATIVLLCFISLSSQADLISHWTFEGNALDTIGGRNGTLLGEAHYSSNVPAALNGISTQSLALDGTLDKMIYDVVGADQVSGTFSVAAWVNPTARRPNGTLTFLGTRHPDGNAFDFKFRTDNRIRLDLGNGSSIPVIYDTPTFPLALDTWYHVAVTVTPGGFSIYLNGSLLSSGTFGSVTPLLWDANHDIAIGAVSASLAPDGPPFGEEFQGYIDDVRVYNHALTDSEVAALVSPFAREIFVSSSGTDVVKRYNAETGAYLGNFAFGNGLDQPRDCVFGPDGNLYVISQLSHNIKCYDGATGGYLFTLPQGGLSNPVGMTFGSDGKLYVTSFSTNNVQRFDTVTRQYLGVFASGISGAYDLVFGPNGDLYVLTTGRNAVMRFDGKTGVSLGDFVSQGSGGLNGPTGATFGPDGQLYVVSRATNQVKKYDGVTGAYLGNFASGAWTGEGINLAFGPDNNLYVSINQIGNSATGKVVRHQGPFGSSPGQYINDFIPLGSGGLAGTTGLLFRNAARPVTGSVTLEDCVNSEQSLSLDFFSPYTGTFFSRSVTLNQNGAFELSGIPTDNYKVRVKGGKWLTRSLTLDMLQEPDVNLTTFLPGGDANNDDFVDVQDLAELIAEFDAGPSSPNWNDGAADFNCDGSVDVLDLDLLIRNFDKEGDA